MPGVKTIGQLVTENPSVLSILNPLLSDTMQVSVEGVNKIVEMISDQNAIIRDCNRIGADPTRAAGIRDGLMYALGILKFEEANNRGT